MAFYIRSNLTFNLKLQASSLVVMDVCINYFYVASVLPAVFLVGESRQEGITVWPLK